MLLRRIGDAVGFDDPMGETKSTRRAAVIQHDAATVIDRSRNVAHTDSCMQTRPTSGTRDLDSIGALAHEWPTR